MYATLLPLEEKAKQDAAVGAYMAAVGAHPAVAEARAELGGNVGDVFAADTAAYIAAKPKLPIKGKRNILVRLACKRSL